MTITYVIIFFFVISGTNAILTYDVRLAYKTDEMYEMNLDWKLEVESRESRKVQCQPIYHHADEDQVRLCCFFVLFLNSSYH